MRLVATYFDGRVEYLDLDNKEVSCSYDSNYCGEQDVTAGYRGATGSGLHVTTTGGACSNCTNLCEDRSYADYQRNRRCNDCLQDFPAFYGLVWQDGTVTTEDVIREALDRDGVYRLSKNDTLIIKYGYDMSKVGIFAFLPTHTGGEESRRITADAAIK